MVGAAGEGHGGASGVGRVQGSCLGMFYSDMEHRRFFERSYVAIRPPCPGGYDKIRAL